jgi:hypothetical protein
MPLTGALFFVRYRPAGEFLLWVATKLTQSPSFLNTP